MPTHFEIDNAAEVQACREVLKPTPVRLGHVPAWFRKRLLKAYGHSNSPSRTSFDASTSGTEVLKHALCQMNNGRAGAAVAVAFDGFDTVWLMHWGTTIVNDWGWTGRQAFVSEPNHFTSETAKQLDAFCGPPALTWYVSTNSYHNPKCTIRIVIPEPLAIDGGVKMSNHLNP